MFFQEAPPDTSGYMIAGYIVAFVVVSLYIFSLYIRNRNLQQDLLMLEEMDKPAAKTENRRPSSKKAANAVTKKSGRK